MIKVRYDDTNQDMSHEKFIEFVDSITVWTNYTKVEFLEKVFEKVPGYTLESVELNFNRKNPSCNIYWKPQSKNRSVVSRFFFI